jgi:hypothetical protein
MTSTRPPLRGEVERGDAVPVVGAAEARPPVRIGAECEQPADGVRPVAAAQASAVPR